MNNRYEVNSNNNRIWEYTDIEEGVILGKNIFIGNGVTIRRGSIIEDNVVIGHNTVIEEDCFVGKNTRIQALVYLAKGTRIEQDVFIGPMVCTTNDKRIMSHGRGDFIPNAPIICKFSRIGARALIMAGIVIEENALIGAGAIVTKNVEEGESWYGEAAFKRGMVSDEEKL